VRNFVYGNCNPGLLPPEHPLRQEIFDDAEELKTNPALEAAKTIPAPVPVVRA
jgi:hypothetical protein